jgi:sialic acid synthase SpsE
MGDGEKRVYDSERGPIEKMSKKLVAARSLEVGDVLTEGDIEARSPGDGLPPSLLGELIGKRLRTPVLAHQALTFELTEGLPDTQPVPDQLVASATT